MFVILVALLNSAMMTQVFYKIKQPLLFPIFNTIFYLVILILLFQKDTLEGFFFEVSPTRKKCLMEQVSRKNFDKKMPCSCCQKGTVGGIPPNYAQWLGKSDSDTSGWFRPDHVQYVDTFSNGQECQSFKQPVYVEHV
jgi:hypothetical protein